MIDSSEQTSSPEHHRQPHQFLMFRLAVLMFWQHAALGLWLATFGSYIAANTGQEGSGIFGPGFVGLASSAGALGALFSPVLVGWLADQRFSSERLLFVLHTCSAAALYAMATCESQMGFYLAILVFFQCFSPTITLMNSVTLQHVDDPDRAFPPLRAIGTVGWIAAGLFLGSVCPIWFGGPIHETTTPMVMAMVAQQGLAFYCLTLPSTPPARVGVAGWKTWVGGRQLWTNRPFVLFVLISVVACIPSQYFNAYLIIYLTEQQYQEPASQMTLCQVSEVLCMFAMPLLLVRFGLKNLFLIGIGAWVARFVMLAYGDGAPWLVYLAMLLHGAAYTFVYIVGQLYIDRVADRSSRAAAQGILMFLTQGVGHLIGSFMVRSTQATYLTPPDVSPPLYDWHSFWLVPAAISAVATVTFALFFHERESPKN